MNICPHESTFDISTCQAGVHFVKLWSPGYKDRGGQQVIINCCAVFSHPFCLKDLMCEKPQYKIKLELEAKVSWPVRFLLSCFWQQRWCATALDQQRLITALWCISRMALPRWPLQATKRAIK